MSETILQVEDLSNTELIVNQHLRIGSCRAIYRVE